MRDEAERVREEAAEAREAASQANERAAAAGTRRLGRCPRICDFCEEERRNEREKAEARGLRGRADRPLAGGARVAPTAEYDGHGDGDVASRNGVSHDFPRTPVVVYNTTAATTPAALDIMSAIDASFSWLPSTTAPASDVRSEIADLHAEVRRLRQTPQANGTDLRNELRELRDEVRAPSGSRPTATPSISTLHHYSATTPSRGPSGPTSAGGRRRRTRLPSRGRIGR